VERDRQRTGRAAESAGPACGITATVVATAGSGAEAQSEKIAQIISANDMIPNAMTTTVKERSRPITVPAY